MHTFLIFACLTSAGFRLGLALELGSGSGKKYKVESCKVTEALIPLKGRGLIATKNIQRGELLITERPLISLTRQEAWFDPPNSNTNLNSNSDSNLPNNLAVIFESLSDDQKKLVLDLHHFKEIGDENPAEQDSLLGRFRTNALPIHESREGYAQHGLFPLISRINNECRPNVHYRYYGKETEGCIYAVRDIPLGGELSLSYGNQLQAKASRQSFIERNFGFICTCPVCMKEGPALASDDSLREMVGRLQPEASRLLQDGLYEYAEQVLTLRLKGIDLLGLDNDPSIGFQTVYDGFSAACSYLDSKGIDKDKDKDYDQATIQYMEMKKDYYLRRASEYESTFRTNYVTADMYDE